MNEPLVISSGSRVGWAPLFDPPGEIPSAGAELTAFSSFDGRFTCGLWEREPDTWSFERPYDEVAYVLSGHAKIDSPDGSVDVGAGDVLVTPNGSIGTWEIGQTLVKFFAIYEGGEVTDPRVQVIKEHAPVTWTTLATAPRDPTPPGEEWYAWRSPDGAFSTGIWRRAPETGPMELDYDEVALLIEGEVDVEGAAGARVSVSSGDVLVTPHGFCGTWKARTAVRKFWAVHH